MQIASVTDGQHWNALRSHVEIERVVPGLFNLQEEALTSGLQGLGLIRPHDHLVDARSKVDHLTAGVADPELMHACGATHCWFSKRPSYRS